MCAIAAILYFDNTSDRVDRDELLRMRDHMIARGPDGAGEWFSPDGKAALAHRRLAIIDLSEAGAQPMTSSPSAARGEGRNERTPRHVVTFNGEIYNYRQLRSELEAKGYVFRS